MRVKRVSIIQEDDTSEKEDLTLIEGLLIKYKDKKGNLIPILQGVQNTYRYLPDDALIKIADSTGHKLSAIYGVATFYAQFRLKPVGKHVIKVCHGTACHVQDAKVITTSIKEHLKIEDGETTANGIFTLESVACLGCCSLAPVMMIGADTFGKLTGKSSVKVIRELKRKELAKKVSE